MKHLSVLCLLSLASLAMKAQSGLQFNQALFISVTVGSYTSANFGTVPAGKVWKLEQVACSSTTGPADDYSFTFNNNGGRYQIPSTSAGAYNLAPDVVYWWPAGTQIGIYSNWSSASTIFINILEFNIVQ